jgi:hypothetical protein
MADIAATIQAVLAIIGGVAAGYFFVVRRESYPRAQFDLSMRILGERREEILLELSASIRNIGLVRHSITKFSFSLRGLQSAEKWEMNSEKLNLIDFPTPIAKGLWVRCKYTTIIDPGTDQKFYFTVKSPSNIQYFNLYANLIYKAKWVPDHSASITRSLAELRKQFSQSSASSSSTALEGGRADERAVPAHAD